MCCHCGCNGFLLTMSCRTHVCWQAVLDYRKQESPYPTLHRELLLLQRAGDLFAEVHA